MSTTIKFCGAAGVVTGSSYLVSTPEGSFLIDCGLFQGTKTVRELNYGDFGFDPAKLSFVLLTHAHIDHSGLLPKLYKNGFTGKVYTTEATRDLLEYMLPDSANIQESEVRRLNARNAQRGLPEVNPIYTQEDAETCLRNISFININGWVDLPLGVKARFWNAGHILGSASIELKVGGEHLLFSGDIGPDNKMFHPAPESPHDIDYLITESTYGGRKREDWSIDARRVRLRDELLAAMKTRGGNILIPSFAVERTQELLLDIDWLIEHSQIPEWRIFIDSPLASRVTGVFQKHSAALEDLSGKSDPFKGRNIHFVGSVEESMGLSRMRSGVIIMAASGMCEAGRIRHHLKNNLWNPESTVLFVGYQAEGTLGRLLESGAPRVRIMGEEVEVRARIRAIEGYSAHADQAELVEWVKARLPIRKSIFITHGVDDQRRAMTEKLTEAGVVRDKILLPMIDDVYRLDAPAAARVGDGAPRLAPASMTATDWHNDYARLVLDIAQRLREMKDPEARSALLADLGRKVRDNGR